MRRSISLLPHLAGALLSWYTPVVFLMMIGITFVHDSLGHGWSVWLGWPIALTTAALAGTRIRLLSLSRLPGLWPQGWTLLGRALVLLVLLACLPAWILAPAANSPVTAAMGAVTLAMAGLATALRFGPNGVMWLVVTLMFLGLPQHLDGVIWLLNPVPGVVTLLLAGWLAWLGWRRCAHERDRGASLPGRLRLLLRDRPGQPLGWRLMLAYLAFGVVVMSLIWLTRSGWPDLGDLDTFTEVGWTVTFISAVLLGITVAHELFNFRAALRLLFVLPGHDRNRLRLQAAGGLFRAWLILGLTPHLALAAFAAMYTTIPTTQVVLVSVVAVTVLAAIATLVLRVVAASEHATAVLALVGTTLLILIASALWHGLWNQLGAVQGWLKYTALAAAATVLFWYWARSAWMRLSLERVDHWPLVKLSRESSFG